MRCKICKEATKNLFITKVLNRYSVQYFQCTICDFVFTEHPYWLDEAYDSAITKLDIGLPSRSINSSFIVSSFIDNVLESDVNSKYLDFGGGYGLFVRLMRDKGYNFFRQDVYCANLFAEFFDLNDLDKREKFELVTAFEVMEHIVDPLNLVKEISSLTDTFLFSTQTLPKGIETPNDWWYFIPETGQHVSLYSEKSLRAIATLFDMHYSTNDLGLHLFSRKKIAHFSFRVFTNYYVSKINNILRRHPSLLQKDFDYIRNKLANGN